MKAFWAENVQQTNTTSWLHVDSLSVYMLVKCFESPEVLYKFPIIITIFFCFKCELLGARPCWFTLRQWRAENGWLMMNEAHFCHTCRPLELRAQEVCESRGGRPGLPVPNKPYGCCWRKEPWKRKACQPCSWCHTDSLTPNSSAQGHIFVTLKHLFVTN